MKQFFMLGVCMILALGVFGEEMKLPPAPTNAIFDSMKTLQGTWQTKAPDGNVSHVTYKLVSNGTALMETVEAPGEEMITMYVPDNNTVVLTHYCAEGNQPRMRAKAGADTKTIAFEYMDATSLASPDAPHMHHMTMTIKDQDHVSSAWTAIDKGKEQTMNFDLERVK